MKSYLEYVSEVLGLRTIMMPAPLTATDAEDVSGAEERVAFGSHLHVAAHAPVDESPEPLLTKPGFFYSAAGAFVEGHDFKKCALAIVNWVREESESLFDPVVAELFGKMLSAMKIDPAEVLVLDCVMNERALIPNELFKVCDPQIVLFFSADPISLSEMQIKGPARWLETLSPAVLVQQPQSKKLVWNDMQKIMKELQ